MSAGCGRWNGLTAEAKESVRSLVNLHKRDGNDTLSDCVEFLTVLVFMDAKYKG